MVTETTVRLLLVEDQTIVREGLRRLLETQDDLAVVGEADAEEAAVTAYKRLQPDVVLMDLKLGAGSGLNASRTILREHPSARILTLTAYDDFPMVEEAIAVGLLGYAPKQITLSELVRAIRAVFQGQQYVHPAILPVLLAGIRQHAVGHAQAKIPPSAEERRMLELMARGLSVGEVAAALFLSERTVRRHIQTLFERLEVSNPTQAVALAIRQGWL